MKKQIMILKNENELVKTHSFSTDYDVEVQSKPSIPLWRGHYLCQVDEKHHTMEFTGKYMRLLLILYCEVWL